MSIIKPIIHELSHVGKVVTLSQGTQEWLDWRLGGIGASEAAAVMDTSDFDTPVSLWERKTGRIPPIATNPWMQRGHNLEPIARDLYNRRYGTFMSPQCIQSPAFPWLKASLDGLNFEGDRILEIKCPGAEAHAYALAGIVPPTYYPQVQHQMMVAGPHVRENHYFSFDGDDGVLVICPRNDEYCEKLFYAEQRFWECVKTDMPPVYEQEMSAAHAWRTAKMLADQAKANLDYAKSRVLSAAKMDPTQPGKRDLMLCKVSVSTMKGSVDYEALLRDHFIELTDELANQYRGPSGITVKLTADRRALPDGAYGTPDPTFEALSSSVIAPFTW